jgi:hypothetical protein
MVSRPARLICVGKDHDLLRTRCAVLSIYGYDAKSASTEEWMIQVRALATMTFTLMETQLHGFLKANGAFLAWYFQRDKEQYGSKAWLL